MLNHLITKQGNNRLHLVLIHDNHTFCHGEVSSLVHGVIAYGPATDHRCIHGGIGRRGPNAFLLRVDGVYKRQVKRPGIFRGTQ